MGDAKWMCAGWEREAWGEGAGGMERGSGRHGEGDMSGGEGAGGRRRHANKCKKNNGTARAMPLLDCETMFHLNEDYFCLKKKLCFGSLP